ncbi:MAG: ABC-F family ATP-binding cassette domain-containing protein [Solirubrobacteraceae bacterium]|nr:ABC-F family ATP-binding cassette domain-containing protein [Solirubrobacteraceae bacterium]
MPATLLHAERLTRRHGDRTLLDAVDLRISAGDRVAIVGPNGAGKSTLLRLLAGAELPDGGTVHRHAMPLYLPQPGRRPADGRALRTVLAERLGAGPATAALDIAVRRLQVAGEDDIGDAIEAHAAALDDWIAAGADTLDADLERAADRIGLPPELLDRPMQQLSSGQASRAAMLALAAARHPLVLADEPSNHLDAAGRTLLDELLEAHQGALVLASHDRALLARHAVRVVEIDPHRGTLTEYAGGWEAHEREREATRVREHREYAEAVHRRDELREAEREIRRRAAATRARVGRSPRDNDKHHKEWFTSRADGVAARGRVVGARASRVDVPDRPWSPRPLALALTPQERAGWLVELDGAAARRGDWESPPWTLGVRAGDRLLLRGPNGAGKSTLLGLLGGTLEPVRGRRTAAAGAVVAELGAIERAFTADLPLADVVRGLTGLDPSAARGQLAHVGLGADQASRPAATLSQGERTRAELAVLGASRTSLLLLDEPTDHLDLASVEAVEAALDGWPGAVVVATHDERFAERLGAREVIDV